jgi:hypothetical protein
MFCWFTKQLAKAAKFDFEQMTKMCSSKKNPKSESPQLLKLHQQQHQLLQILSFHHIY